MLNLEWASTTIPGWLLKGEPEEKVNKFALRFVNVKVGEKYFVQFVRRTQRIPSVLTSQWFLHVLKCLAVFQMKGNRHVRGQLQVTKHDQQVGGCVT